MHCNVANKYLNVKAPSCNVRVFRENGSKSLHGFEKIVSPVPESLPIGVCLKSIQQQIYRLLFCCCPLFYRLEGDSSIKYDILEESWTAEHDKVKLALTG